MPIHRFEIGLLCLLAVLYAIVRWSILDAVGPVLHGDSNGYIAQYETGFSEGFVHRRRPWAYPLFIFLMGHDLDRVIVVQRLIAIVSWIILAFSMSRFFSTRATAIFAFTATLLLSLTLNIIQWDVSILSESISISFLALITAILIPYFAAGSTPAGTRLTALLLLAPVALIFAALRDANLFLLPVISTIILINFVHYLMRSRQPHRRPPVIHFIVTLGVAASLMIGSVVQLQSIDTAKRSWFNIANAIAIRAMITPQGANYVLDRSNIQWFRQHYQLPDEAVRRAGKVASATPPKINDDYIEWIKETGIGAWKKFVLTHPAWALKVYIQSRSLFGYSGNIYMQMDETPELWAEAWLSIPINLHQSIYHLFGWLLAADWLHELLLITLIGLWAFWGFSFFTRNPREYHSTIAVMVFLSTAIVLNISLALFADAMEDWRHALMGLIALHIGAIFTLSAILDAYARVGFGTKSVRGKIPQSAQTPKRLRSKTGKRGKSTKSDRT